MDALSNELERCVGCGAMVPVASGATHKYMESAPGCWALFGEVLALEYSDYRYAKVHRLSVDAYAVQHPGQPSPQTIQSVALHLISLCLILEHQVEMEHATKAIQLAAQHKSSYSWLVPPDSLGSKTVLDVWKGKEDADGHEAVVRAWAQSAWEAWTPHYETVRGWIPKELGL